MEILVNHLLNMWIERWGVIRKFSNELNRLNVNGMYFYHMFFMRDWYCGDALCVCWCARDWENKKESNRRERATKLHTSCHVTCRRSCVCDFYIIIIALPSRYRKQWQCLLFRIALWAKQKQKKKIRQKRNIENRLYHSKCDSVACSDKESV